MSTEFFIDEIHSFIAFDTAHTVFTFLSNPPYYTNLSYFHLFFFFNIWAAYSGWQRNFKTKASLREIIRQKT